MTLVAFLAGLLWGALVGALNAALSRHFLKKNNTSLILASNLLRLGVDFAALGAVLLLRQALPLPWEAVLVGTAVGLSAVTLVFAFRFGKK